MENNSISKKFEEIYSQLKERDERNWDIKTEARNLTYDNGRIYVGSSDKEGLALPVKAKDSLIRRYGIDPSEFDSQFYEEEQRTIINEILKRDESGIFLRNSIARNGEKFVRAIFSEEYTPVNNLQLFEMLMENVDYSLDPKVTGYSLNDDRFFMRMVYGATETRDRKSVLGLDDVLNVGVDIVNSETGTSSVIISSLVFRLVCLNGLRAWRADDIFKRKHAFISESGMNDLVSSALINSISKGEEFRKRFVEAKNDLISNPRENIRIISEHFRIPKKDVTYINQAFDIEPENNRYGLVNAFTRGSKLMSVDKRLHVERCAGRILEEYPQIIRDIEEKKANKELVLAK